MPRLDKINAARLSLVVAVSVLGLKWLAFALTGSAALKADAIETIINVVSALAGLWALSVSDRPADENHAYGHGKAEYLSAVAEGVLVILAALTIARVAWQAWANPRHLHLPWIGLSANALGGLLNLGWGLTMVRLGRQQRSPALIAGGRHVLADVWTTAGVLAGIALIPLTGIVELDSVISGMIALKVLQTGYGMMRESISGLMDEAPDSETLREIRQIISEHAEGALEAHDVRARVSGAMSFIEFHLVVPGEMSVNQSHQICDRIEGALRRQVGDTSIHIHVEPDSKAKQCGIPVLI